MPHPLAIARNLCSLLVVVVLLQAATGWADEDDAKGPLPAETAAESMIVPPGFQVTLFAGEPDVRQPIGFCIDDRGRLWVAEAYNYPRHGTTAGDRIVIFEDVDHDGRFDRRTVFYDKLNYVTGIEVGFGGAWVVSPPYFYFIPDRDGDDRPDGPPKVLLDGFGNHANAHNLANGLAWGPDGWLYGTHGRTNWSLLGKPGTSKADRVRFDGGVYRYHPVRHVWEPFADGTTNPWGIDFDDWGQGFICNCVNPHLFHVIQGAHYEPWRNRASSQHAYERIPTIADHLHYTGGGDVRAGLGTADEHEQGGGHAHCGTMIYLGDNWPNRYRNTVFTHNIHGRRINNDLLRRAGSGYVASHGADIMISQDPWFMGVTLCYGPDGAVYSSDWSDTGECHSVRNTRRETGRIFKISYGKPKQPQLELATKSNRELVALQRHRNDWYVRHARRLLQERAARGDAMSDARAGLLTLYETAEHVPHRLRALWALWAIEGVDTAFLNRQLDDPEETIRAWAVRLLTEQGTPPGETLSAFRRMAAEDPSPFVRLHLASALQRLPAEMRWPIAARLAARGEDADDANLPLMVWYGVEPLVDVDLDKFIALAETTEIPTIREHVARRAAGQAKPGTALSQLIALLSRLDAPAAQADLLAGTLQGLAGRRTVAMPDAWPAVYEQLRRDNRPNVMRQATQLALLFNDPAALATLRAQARDATAPAAMRRDAIDALVAKRPPELADLLFELAGDSATAPAAINGLAELNHPRTAERLLGLYRQLEASAQRNAVDTMASRRDWAAILLAAVGRNDIPRDALTAFTARQIRSLDDEKLSAQLATLWGEVRATPAEKRRSIERLKRRFTPEALARADRSAGRLIFQKSCANCHRLFDDGGKIGPDITGAQRHNLDYLIENLVDPSAAVARDYQMQRILTTSGRVITGLVVAESENAVTVQTPNERLVVPVDEVDERSVSEVSMMPDGLLKPLSPTQLLDLVAYLVGKQQVPLPATDSTQSGRSAPSAKSQ